MYTRDDIHVITPAEAIRRRPAMYIGDTSLLGLHMLVAELLDVPLNPSRISLRLQGDTLRIAASSVPPSVRPRAEGHPPFLVEVCTALMTSLDSPPTLAGVETLDESRSPATFERLGAAPACLAIANALSSEFEIASSSHGTCSRVAFRRGEVAIPLAEASTDAPDGVEIVFMPDRDIFSTGSFRFSLLARLAREASLVRHVSIELRDEVSGTLFTVGAG
jgi:DNA gyrase subunit B